MNFIINEIEAKILLREIRILRYAKHDNISELSNIIYNVDKN